MTSICSQPAQGAEAAAITAAYLAGVCALTALLAGRCFKKPRSLLKEGLM